MHVRPRERVWKRDAERRVGKLADERIKKHHQGSKVVGERGSFFTSKVCSFGWRNLLLASFQVLFATSHDDKANKTK